MIPVERRGRLLRPRAVTFDCWATLLYEVKSGEGAVRRARLFAAHAGVDEEPAREALDAAWRRHQVSWHRRVVFDGAQMTDDALEALGLRLSSGERAALVQALEDDALSREVRAVEGAGEALEVLSRAGVKMALICDTGFSPGRVVRRLLDRVGLLNQLGVTVFSDEVGVPKPHEKVFRTALDALGVEAGSAVHVGDLRRSDIAGARAVGMGSVRLTARHDDADSGGGRGAGVIDCVVAECPSPCPRPEADAVVPSFERLVHVLGF